MEEEGGDRLPREALLAVVAKTRAMVWLREERILSSSSASTVNSVAGAAGHVDRGAAVFGWTPKGHTYAADVAALMIYIYIYKLNCFL